MKRLRWKDRAILIITNREDPGHADLVCAALKSISVRHVRFNCEDFPSGPARLAGQGSDANDRESGRIWLNLHSEPERSFIQQGDIRTTLAEIRTIWYRRPRPPMIPAHVAGDFRKVAIETSQGALEAMYSELKRRRWVNAPWHERRCNKWHQAREAAKLGFRVPRTIVTTDPKEAREFARTNAAGTVYKPQRPYVRSNNDREFYALWTSEVSSQDLENSDMFALSPVVLQERIEKAHELRVTVIGREMFAVKIDSQAHRETSLDWRKGSRKRRLSQTPVKLPAAVQKRIRQLMQALGLVFGAIDIIVTPGGDYYFLEINASGQWLWLELETGLPLLQSFVRLLVGGQDNPSVYKGVPAFDIHTLTEALGSP